LTDSIEIANINCVELCTVKLVLLGKCGFTVLTCGKLFGKLGAPYMKEWLRYQKKVGIDHVHWNVTIKSKTLENSYIKKQ